MYIQNEYDTKAATGSHFIGVRTTREQAGLVVESGRPSAPASV
jgi:hypothetical protein